MSAWYLAVSAVGKHPSETVVSNGGHRSDRMEQVKPYDGVAVVGLTGMKGCACGQREAARAARPCGARLGLVQVPAVKEMAGPFDAVEDW